MPPRIHELSLDQQRLRLMVLRTSEQAKLDTLIQTLESLPEGTSEVNAAMYEAMVAKQQKAIARLTEKIERLTDQLEGPDLRQRLRHTEADLAQAHDNLRELHAQSANLKRALDEKDAQLQRIQKQLKNVQDLNDGYVQQIAVLSIHKRQNNEDLARAVLTISNHLTKLGLNIPAKASAKILDSESEMHELDEDNLFASNPKIDQTIFTQRQRIRTIDYSVSLVISSITPDYDTSPIEVKLTEIDRQTGAHQTRILRGFAMPDSILAAEFMVSVCKRLSDRQSDPTQSDTDEHLA